MTSSTPSDDDLTPARARLARKRPDPGFTGASNDVGAETFGSDSQYLGARGLPKEFIEDLERQFGFDKPPLERFLNMLWDYMRLDFGESYFRSI